jgi:adenosylcobinamide kinase/adenosylcobinamide-phosphate guanylyltransferase
MFDMTKDLDTIPQKIQEEVEEKVYIELYNLIEAIRKKDYNLVMVTNEVGYSLVPENHIGRVFRDIQGRINQKVAALSDEVYLVCCGIPVKIK